nr:RimK family alpha-L-glutamate ligase [Candidatus Sigynarchaeota archaeon]
MANGTGLEAGIIVGSLDNSENIQLQRAFERANIKAAMMMPEDIAIGINLNSTFYHDRISIDSIPGFVVRGIGFTTMTRSFYRMDTLYALEARGKVLVNGARATETAMNKCLTSVALDAAGISTPATIVAENLKHALASFEKLGGDVLIKPVYGSQGIGIFRVQDKGYAENVFLEMFRNGHVFYVQEFHPWACPPGITASHPFDVRVVVIGGGIAGAMIRESPLETAWKTNVHQGAVPRAYDPPEEVRELARRAARAIHLDIAGVDLLFSAKTQDWVVLEVNCAPGWTGLAKVCDADIPARIVEFYRQRIRK